MPHLTAVRDLAHQGYGGLNDRFRRKDQKSVSRFGSAFFELKSFFLQKLHSRLQKLT